MLSVFKSAESQTKEDEAIFWNCESGVLKMNVTSLHHLLLTPLGG